MKNSIRTLAMLGMAAGLALSGRVHADDAATSADTTQDQIEELRSSLGTMTAQLNDMADKTKKGVTFSVNTDIRYDEQQYSSIAAPNGLAGTTAPANGLRYVKTAVNNGHQANGMSGIYVRRAEIEASAPISTWAKWDLQVDLAGLKLEDVGVELNQMSMSPMRDTGSWTWDMKIGQYRQPFGIEQQTGSSSIAFSDRAMMYGGGNPAGYGKLVDERIMGLHFTQQHSFGDFGYKLQFAIANDAAPAPGAPTANKGNSDQSSGQTSANTAFPDQATDTNPSEFGRVGFDLNFIPGILLNVGESAIANSMNTVPFDTAAKNEWSSAVNGSDATLQVPGAHLKFWGEFVGSDTFYRGAAGGSYDGGPANGLIDHAEGWYLTSSMQPLAFFWDGGQGIDFNFRYDNYTTSDEAATIAKPWQVSSEQAISYGIKWSYVGKNYTSVDYTIYAFNGDFSTLADMSLFTVQQQFNF